MATWDQDDQGQGMDILFYLTEKFIGSFRPRTVKSRSQNFKLCVFIASGQGNTILYIIHRDYM